MNAKEAAARIGACLDDDGLPYGVGGALALGVWGAPRATKDVDVTVFVDEHELPRVVDALERAGVMVDRNAATKDVARIGLFKGRIGRIAVDVFMLGHPQYDDMARRLRRIEDADGVLSVISPEDLAIHKLVFGRAKDITDLERLFAVRRDLDIGYVRSWMARMVPANDRRLAALDDLERRFTSKA
ncbi:MAG TPA: DUF6036 family nucleotidyltransferase [Kofleriaceae bacterium]